MRNLYLSPWDQAADLEAAATATRLLFNIIRESEAGGGGKREAAQLDVEEDALRMLCQS